MMDSLPPTENPPTELKLPAARQKALRAPDGNTALEPPNCATSRPENRSPPRRRRSALVYVCGVRPGGGALWKSESERPAGRGARRDGRRGRRLITDQLQVIIGVVGQGAWL